MHRFSPALFCAVVAAAALGACSGGGGTPHVIASSMPTVSPSAVATVAPTPAVTVSATASPKASASAVATASPKPTGSASPGSSPTPTPHATATATPAATLDDWPLAQHDAARSGVSNESGSAPASLTLKQLWQKNIGDVADTSPIEWNGMIFLTVHGGQTYGISAATGRTMWTFATTGNGPTTSEPAYDASAGVLYAGGVDGKIHRLNPTTGVEDTSHGFPVTITLATRTEKDSSPLNVANGYVYAQTSGYNGDAPPYVGHVVAISTSTGALHVFNTLCAAQKALIDPSTCDQSDSGLWSRAGPVVDPDSAMGGAVFAATGNGYYDPSGGYFGDTLLALKPDVSSLLGYFAPSNALQLQQEDLDLGSTSPALLPRQGTSSTPLMALQGGKDAVLRLVDRSDLTGASSLLQSISIDAKVYSAPAIYQSPGGPLYAYVGLPDGVYAYTLTTLGGASQLTQVWKANLTLGGEGTSAIVRAGVVYVAASNQLVALDAKTGTTLGSATIGGVHWESPMAARGVVYVTDESHNLTAFQIVPGASAANDRRVQKRST